jgi:nitrogen fixation protein FixH
MNILTERFRQRRALTGRAVLIWFLLFFGITVAVNATFAYVAFASWPGLSLPDGKERTGSYNRPDVGRNH